MSRPQIYTSLPALNNTHQLTNLNRLLLTTVASRNGIHSCLVQAEKGKFGVLTLSHKICPRKQPKLVILVSFQEKLPHTRTPVIASTYCGKYSVTFFLGHPVLLKNKAPFNAAMPHQPWKHHSVGVVWHTLYQRELGYTLTNRPHS